MSVVLTDGFYWNTSTGETFHVKDGVAKRGWIVEKTGNRICKQDYDVWAETKRRLNPQTVVSIKESDCK